MDNFVIEHLSNKVNNVGHIGSGRVEKLPVKYHFFGVCLSEVDHEIVGGAVDTVEMGLLSSQKSDFDLSFFFLVRSRN